LSRTAFGRIAPDPRVARKRTPGATYRTDPATRQATNKKAIEQTPTNQEVTEHA
jgi:hypothetical protein